MGGRERVRVNVVVPGMLGVSSCQLLLKPAYKPGVEALPHYSRFTVGEQFLTFLTTRF